MRRLAFLTLSLGILSAAPAHAVSIPPPEQTKFQPCSRQSIARCGHVLVPLDRPAATSAVSIFVRRARLPGPKRGTVFALAGGPGQAATPFADGTAYAFRRALKGREVVTFDQRGIGGSGLLRCPTLAAIGDQTRRIAGAVEDCADTLGLRRAFYTTRDSVEDLEAVRRAVHAEKVILYGTSYGTKLALAYAGAYPQHVESLVLDSVVAANGPDPFMRDSLGEVPRILRQRCGTACAKFTQDPAADLAALVARIGHDGILRGPLVRRDGRPHPARLGRVRLVDLLFAGDFDPTLRAAIPAAVRSALNGDPAPLLRLTYRGTAEFTDPVSYFNPAIFAATVCEEGPLPFTRTTPFSERYSEAMANFNQTPDSALGGFDRSTAFTASGTFELCRLWPSAPVAPAISTGPFPAVPALVLSGQDDIRTPLSTAQARREAASKCDARVGTRRWPQRARLAERRLRAPRTAGLPRTACDQALPPGKARRAPRAGCANRPHTARPHRMFPGVAGRTLAAIKRTLQDAGKEFDASFFSPPDPSRPSRVCVAGGRC